MLEYGPLFKLSSIIGNILGYAICAIGYICISTLIIWVTIIQIYNLTIKVLKIDKDRISSISNIPGNVLIIVPAFVIIVGLYSFFQNKEFHESFILISQAPRGIATIATYIGIPILIIIGIIKIIKKIFL